MTVSVGHGPAVATGEDLLSQPKVPPPVSLAVNDTDHSCCTVCDWASAVGQRSTPARASRPVSRTVATATPSARRAPPRDGRTAEASHGARPEGPEGSLAGEAEFRQQSRLGVLQNRGGGTEKDSFGALNGICGSF